MLLCNLGIALSQTDYDPMFATIAFEEALKANPHNEFIMENYLLYLVDSKQFDRYKRTIPNAKRLLDQDLMKNIQTMFNSMVNAIKTLGGSGIEVKEDGKSNDFNKSPLGGKLSVGNKMANLLKSIMSKKNSKTPSDYSRPTSIIQEENDD